MSGPALRQLDAHHAIHQAAYTEAEELTEILRGAVNEGQSQCQELSLVLIEHWQTRILRHADEEEAGLYKELVDHDPELAPIIQALARDHDLMRRLTADIERDINEQGFTPGIMNHFETLLWLSATHSQTEEQTILAQGVAGDG